MPSSFARVVVKQRDPIYLAKHGAFLRALGEHVATSHGAVKI